MITEPTPAVPLSDVPQSPRPPQSEEPTLPRGDTDENPRSVGFFDLIREDFRTHGSSFLEPGFWALATHRFGNWRMGIKPKILRAPLSIVYKAGFTSINWLWGIDLGYT